MSARQEDAVGGKIDRLFERACRAIEIVLALAFLLAVCLNFLNVIGRYVLGYTPSGTDEIQIYIMVWMAFGGAAVITWRDLHLRMDVLFQRLPATLRIIVRGFELTVFILIAGFVTLQSFYYVMRMFRLGQVSDLAGIPVWIPHSAVVIGFALMAVVLLRRAVAFALGETGVRAPQTVHKDATS
jgi:TRAP-type C4-dicarboxylate transport system permease small subunit